MFEVNLARDVLPGLRKKYEMNHEREELEGREGGAEGALIGGEQVAHEKARVTELLAELETFVERHTAADGDVHVQLEEELEGNLGGDSTLPTLLALESAIARWEDALAQNVRRLRQGREWGDYGSGSHP